MTFDILTQEVQKISQATAKIQSFLPRLTPRPLVRFALMLTLFGSFVGTLFLVLISNLFFSWYYSPPAEMKFVKTQGAVFALYLHNLVDYNFQEETKNKIASLKIKGGKEGLIVNQKVESFLNQPLVVSGSSIALRVNTQIGQIPETPLPLVKSYQEGLTSAYLVGTNYHSPQKFLSVQGYSKGVLVNAELNQMQSSQDLFLSSLGLLETAEHLLQVDVNQLLNQSNNRADTLNNYLVALKKSENELNLAETKVKSELSFWQSEEKNSRNLMAENEKNFFSALRIFSQTETKREFNQFIEIGQKNLDQKANLQAMTQIDEYIKLYAPAMALRHQALLENREPLIYGVKVVAFRDVDLGLIEIK